MKTKRLWYIVGFLTMAMIIAGTLAFDQPGRKNNIQIQPDYALDGCTVIIVGKDASTDGSVMTTHTCDCGVCDWTWRAVPAADHEPGAMRKIYRVNRCETWPPEQGLKWDVYTSNDTGVEIPQPAHTYA